MSKEKNPTTITLARAIQRETSCGKNRSRNITCKTDKNDKFQINK